MVENRLTRSVANAVAFFESQKKRVFKQSELRQILAQQATAWGLPQRFTSTPKFIAFLIENTPLREITIRAEEFDRRNIRYTWGDPRQYEVALSLGKNPYLSHVTAVFLHGLTEQIPKTIFINDEQSPKPSPAGGLTQEGIDQAFAGKQRQSRAYWSGEGIRVLMLSGKNTGRLEVGNLAAPDGSLVEATKLERTLIDIAVRPEYGGGPYMVLDAYAAARGRISMNVLMATLKKLDYVYPYHQVIGFFMTRAGYELRRLEPLKRLGLNFDFYLSYGMKKADYDDEWRLFIPKGF